MKWRSRWDHIEQQSKSVVTSLPTPVHSQSQLPRGAPFQIQIDCITATVGINMAAFAWGGWRHLWCFATVTAGPSLTLSTRNVTVNIHNELICVWSYLMGTSFSSQLSPDQSILMTDIKLKFTIWVFNYVIMQFIYFLCVYLLSPYFLKLQNSSNNWMERSHKHRSVYWAFSPIY